jgi:hypothetical protein
MGGERRWSPRVNRISRPSSLTTLVPSVKATKKLSAQLLDPNVTWQGLHEDWVCHGPDEVIETLQEGLRLRRNVAALEFVRAGSRLVMGVRGPSLDEVGGEPLDGQIFNVFTLSNGKIVRIEDYRLRAEALKAAQADEDSRWR